MKSAGGCVIGDATYLEAYVRFPQRNAGFHRLFLDSFSIFTVLYAPFLCFKRKVQAASFLMQFYDAAPRSMP